MKKNLFYLFALICTMSLFTACSDDDEPWKEIPQEEITVGSGDATLQVNGETSTTGSVKMTVKNESEATLEMKDVIPGYSNLNVDVELQKQADNSYKFAGTAQVNTAPVTRLAASEPALLTVEVDGTITLDGKVNLNVTATGAGLFVGTYNGAQLALNYSDAELVGKTVYYTITNSVPVLTLANVVPGEPTTTISGVYLDKDGAFSGEVTTATGASMTYSGTITAASGMALNVGVTLSTTAQGELTGSWPLSHKLYDSKMEYDDPPFFLNWPAIDDDENILSGEQLSLAGTALVSQFLAEVLNGVTFEADGNLTAKYYPGIVTGKNEAGEDIDFQTWLLGKLFAMNIDPLDREWLTSPKNLIQWYAKEGKLYLIPNIAQILQQVSKDTGTTIDADAILHVLQLLQTADDETLMGLIKGFAGQYGIVMDNVNAALIKEVLGWLNTGIPLNYEKTATGLKISVDKKMVEPFMLIILDQLPALQVMWEELVAKDETGMMGMALLLIGVPKFTDFITVWNENTADFGLGLFFVNK